MPNKATGKRMNVLIVLAHHEPGSFNGAMAKTARDAFTRAGHDVVISDLYADKFNAVSTRADFLNTANPAYLKYQAEQKYAVETNGFVPELAREQARLEASDLLIFQFPLWWFSVPGILKGWIDRVFAADFAYGGGRWFESAPLVGRRAILSFTMSAKPDRWGENSLFGPLEWCLHPLHVGLFNFCGFETLQPQIVHSPAAMTVAEREAALAAWSQRCVGIFDESPLPVRRTVDFEMTPYRGV
jgi:putative NADPH-quinone reductase